MIRLRESIVEHRSPYDEVPGQLVHRPEALTATANELDRLTKAIYPDAVEVLRSAVARQTGSSSAAVLDEEARNVLKELLEDPDGVDQDLSGEDAEHDRSLRALLERAVGAEARRSLEGETPAWLEMRGIDLARATAGVWSDFGREEAARLQVVESLLEERGGPHKLAVDELARRFELSKDETRDLVEATRKRFKSLVLEFGTGAYAARAARQQLEGS